MSALAELIVAEARTWIGTPYVHQASLKGAGCDCLGLVRGVWRVVTGTEPETPPPYSRDWSERSGTETLRDAAARHMLAIDVAEAREGDVPLFAYDRLAPAKHCAILTGSVDAPGARMIHAYDRLPVAEVALGPWWRRRVRFAFRFPEH